MGIFFGLYYIHGISVLLFYMKRDVYTCYVENLFANFEKCNLKNEKYNFEKLYFSFLYFIFQLSISENLFLGPIGMFPV